VLSSESALDGYIEEYRDLNSGRKFQFEGPKLVYKALTVETVVSDEVFKIN
jgi:hypothetical protein